MSEAKQFTNKQINLITATIASSGTKSTAINVYGASAGAMYIPASFTGTTVTFEGSCDDGTTFKAITNSLGNAVSQTIIADTWHTLDPQIFYPYDQIKIVAASQGAERTILVKPFSI